MKTAMGFRLGPIARLTLGLMALLISLALLADVLLGVVPSHTDTQRRVRQRIAENLALQLTPLIEAGDTVALGKTIQLVLARDPEMQSVAVRRGDGSVLLQRGAAPAPASAERGGASTADHVRVPVLAGRTAWGEIDIRFNPAEPATLRGWLDLPGTKLVLVLGVGGFVLVYAYLRRAMHYLNPSASVPDRVRKAFDSLGEGLLIIDQQARIVLANQAFRQLHPRAEDKLNGKRIDSLDWLLAGSPERLAAPSPWTPTLESGVPVSGHPLELAQPDGPPTQLLVSCSPITDDKGRARGCLITFDDVTAVHRANEELRKTLEQLESSRRRIEEQNVELRRLASRDAMTGCFNRRAFFEFAEEMFSAARRDRTHLCCIMADIDHFKQFNDRYGHAVGDQVIQVVARSLSAGLRQVDVLGRYGGEEFCIVLPGATPQDAVVIAERIRADIEASANKAIRGTEVVPITSSFGVASMSLAASDIEGLIDQADQALYRAKQGGRNRVTLWEQGGIASKAEKPLAAPVH